MELVDLVRLMQEGILLVFQMCAPVLGAALIIGLVVAIFQATTSIQEQTLTFLPKLFVILLMLMLLGTWMFTSMSEYARRLFEMISQIA